MVMKNNFSSHRSKVDYIFMNIYRELKSEIPESWLRITVPLYDFKKTLTKIIP